MHADTSPSISQRAAATASTTAILRDPDAGRAAARRRLATRVLSELIRAGETLLPGCQVDAGVAMFCVELPEFWRAVELGKAARRALILAGFPAASNSSPILADAGRQRVTLAVPCGGPDDLGDSE